VPEALKKLLPCARISDIASLDRDGFSFRRDKLDGGGNAIADEALDECSREAFAQCPPFQMLF
jgi:hypothetical protein